MKYETIEYCPKSQDPACYREVLRNFLETKDSIPEPLKKHFIDMPEYGNEHYIKINLENRDVINCLDHIFAEMIAHKECSKRYLIEIDENEIHNYKYFSITPECLEYGRYTFCNTRMPDCGGPQLIQTEKPNLPFIELNPFGNCRVGEKLLSPVKVIKRKAAKLDLAELHYGGKEKVLLVSARLKRIFDAEGVTGLEYEPAGFLDIAKKVNYHKSGGISYIAYEEVINKNSSAVEPPYIARIRQVICSEADEVDIQAYVCSVHNVVYFKDIVNLRAIPDNIYSNDFFQVEGIIVKGQTYYYQQNTFYVTRKVLEILLKNKATKGFHTNPSLKKTFRPVLCKNLSDDQIQ